MTSTAMRSALAAFVLGLGLAGAGGAGGAEAAFLTYTETAIGSGNLGGASFGGALITITASGDTGGIAEISPGVFRLILPTTVEVAGLGSASFTDTIQVVSNQGVPVGGFGDLTVNRFVLGTEGAAFENYDLGGPIGPITGTASFNGGVSFGTTAGAFIIGDISGRSTFTAAGPTAVPEPSSLALCGVACLAGVALRRRRTAA